MTDLRTAAQQALEALKMMRDEYEEYACPACDHADAAIYALRAALAEPVQEPVAVRWRHPQYRWTYEDYKPGQFYGPRVEVQRLYTAPPQRKPLTEDEIALITVECAASHQHDDVYFARAIERVHGIGGQNEP